MTKTYLVKHKTHGLEFMFKYSKKGYLIEYSSKTMLKADVQKKLSGIFPHYENQIDNFKTKYWAIEELDNLSFEAFWDAYKYKKGTKAKAEKLWKELSEADKAKAMAYIKRYDNELKMTNVGKVYPERYLSQRRFDNE